MKKLYTILSSILISLLLVSPVLACNSAVMDFESGSSHSLSITDANQTGLEPGSTDFSYEAWIKIESFPDSRLSIITKGYSDPAGAAFYVEGRATSGQYKLKADYNGSLVTQTQGYGSTTLNTGIWYHVAVTVDIDASTMIFYVNGTAETTTYTIQTSTSQQDNTKAFGVGGHPADSGYFDGKIDDVRAWSDIRTGTEITNNKSVELVGNEANLVGYWKLNNGILDETSNNNDLTNNNSVPFDTADIPFDVCVAVVPKKKTNLIIFE